MMHYRIVTPILLFVSLIAQTVQAEERKALPWWDDYPLIIETASLEETLKYHATLGFCADHTDPSWGLFAQNRMEVPARTKAFHDAGLKTMSYFETFGTTTVVVTELGKREGDAPTPIVSSFWSWEKYKGGPIQWLGMMDYWEDSEFARPYTYKHPRYGGRPLTYPDGTIAAGYNGPATDPRNSRVLDAACAKDLFGKLTVDFCYHEPVNKKSEATGKPVGPLDGLLETPNGYSGNMSPGKDSACPYWIDYTYASALMATDGGLDSMWTDNFSSWDSFGLAPVKNAFGEWSVAGFRSYLTAHFTPAEIQAMGIAEISTFDVRAAFRAQASAWAGKDISDTDNAIWRDARWLDHPLWRAYKIYKRQAGTQALEAYYGAVKKAAATAGNPDFFVAGNDIPVFSLGWPRGELDAVSMELTPGWHIESGTRGIMLPPAGRFAPVYKLAREHAKSRIVNTWMYLDPPDIAKPGVANALYYEMLANHALPMLHPEIPKVAGTPESNAAFFQFVAEAKKTYAARVPVEEIGLYYSSSSLLAFMTLGGFADHNAQTHQFGYLGWGTALGELHYPYRALPEWKLTAKELAGLRILIIPNAEVFNPEDVEQVLVPWVNTGGRLIVTGNSGVRLGEKKNFDFNPNGYALASLTDVAHLATDSKEMLHNSGAGKVLYLPANVGMDYYLKDTERPAHLAQFNTAIRRVLPEQEYPFAFHAENVPSTVGMTLYQDRSNGRYFVDLNNCAYDRSTDAMTPKEGVTFEVALPAWLQEGKLSAHVLAPDADITVTATRVGKDRAQILLNRLNYYASIVLEVQK